MRELATGRSDAEASPVALPRRWLATIFLVFAAYAGLVALTSALSVHRTWAVFALAGYAAAAASTCWPRRGADLALLVSLAGALALPLGWLAASGAAQREIYVISRSAWMLLHHGTPYRSAAALAGTTNPDAYNPYMPAMSLFGAGNQTLHGGPLADPRIWFTAAFATLFPLALRVAGAVDVPRWTALVTGSPLIAFLLAVGGDDVPVIGLMCLGLALLAGARQPSRPGWAGLAFGIAAALKATAWPAAAGLLVTALAGIAVWLARRPPVTVAAATWRIIATLVLLFLLAPSTRVGYFTYPLTLWAWLRVSSLDARLARIRLTT